MSCSRTMWAKGGPRVGRYNDAERRTALRPVEDLKKTYDETKPFPMRQDPLQSRRRIA